MKSDGYTLVETLVAIAIMLGVLLPATVFFTKIASNRTARDLTSAASLARGEMETVIAGKLFSEDERIVREGNRAWRVRREIQKESGLVEIRVLVFRGNAVKPLVRFQTMRSAR